VEIVIVYQFAEMLTCICTLYAGGHEALSRENIDSAAVPFEICHVLDDLHELL
jgi:hypothetical protein